MEKEADRCGFSLTAGPDGPMMPPSSDRRLEKPTGHLISGPTGRQHKCSVGPVTRSAAGAKPLDRYETHLAVRNTGALRAQTEEIDQ